MKKILFALLLVLPFVFVGCSSDDDDDVYTKEEIVGTWQLLKSEGYYYEDGKKYTYDNDYRSDLDFYVFSDDGKGHNYYGEDEEFYMDFSWRVSGNKLTVIFKEYGETYENTGVINISNNFMTAEHEGREDGEKYYYKDTYKKVD